MRLFEPHRDLIARRAFILSALILAFGYGVVAASYNLFPVPLIQDARLTANDLLRMTGIVQPWYYDRSDQAQAAHIRSAHGVAPGLRLISGLTRDGSTVANVVDVHGHVVHTWAIEWNQIWPDSTHLTPHLLPRWSPTTVHGLALADNGDLVFNFEERGMVRLDACGGVVWRLPYRTHHSIHFDERGHIWAPGLITRTEESARLPNYRAPFQDYTVLEVSPGGRILTEFFVADMLVANGLGGLLYMSMSNDTTTVGGDTLHLNDVETFPTSLSPGIFAPGDIMISLRNINAIVVFDRGRRVKYVSVGAVLRQHDPDFVDGNTIAVFDNNNLSREQFDGPPDPDGRYSRIVGLSALTTDLDVLFSGSRERPFFTHIMGKHQLLPNGNRLLTESVAGRVLEIDAAGNIAWEYFNVLGDGRVGMINDALWLPDTFTPAFFASASAACEG
jgi:hypothetical protein